MPGTGSTVGPGTPIVLHYEGFDPGARDVSGFLSLDGEPAGTFVRSREPSTNANNTSATIVVELRPSDSTPSGARTLGARIFTELDAPIDAVPIEVVLDRAPKVTDGAVSYEPDSSLLRVSANVSDDLSDPLQLSIRVTKLGENVTATNASVPRGPLALDLPVHLRPGDHVASLSVWDGRQSSSASIGFRVLDRLSDVSEVSARYQTGKTLAVSALVEDRDGVVSVAARTEFGAGSLQQENGTQRWSGTFPLNVTRLGAFNGSVEVEDGNLVRTKHNFSFVIDGERVVLLERKIDTGLGGHADLSTYVLPAALGGTIDICMRECGPDADPTRDCGVACDTLHGDPGASPLVRPACGRPEPRTGSGATAQDWLFWTAVRTIEDGRVPNGTGDPRIGAIAPFNAIKGLDVPLLDPGPKVCVDRAAAAQTAGNLVVARGGPVQCVATDTTRCAFSAPAEWSLDVAWKQAPQQTIILRVTGVRI